MKKFLAIAALSLSASLPAFAGTYDNSGHFLMGMGLTFGGDTLYTAHFTDGSSRNVSSGRLVHFYGGYDYRFDNRMSVQTTLGYHFDNISAKNGDISFSRYPLEVLGYYGPTDSFRIGAGFRYAMNPKVSSSGEASGNNRSFKDAAGFVVEAEYLFSPQVGLKVRAVNEKYKQEGSSTSVSGNHGGVYGSYYF